MTLTDLLPIRIGVLDRSHRPARKHRAPDECERLRFLLYGANLYIRGLHLQLDDQDRAHEATVKRIDDRYTATIRDLEDQLTELQQRLNVGVLAEAAAAQTQEIPVIVPVPLAQAPFATTDPGRVGPTWARAEGVA